MSEAPIDHAKLDQARRELGAAFGRILSYYAEDGEKSVAEIEKAARARNAACLVRPAHTLKGESLQFGAVPLAALAERIEQAARLAVEDHTFPIEVVEEAARVRPLFEQALASLTGAMAVPPPPGTPTPPPAPPSVPVRRPAGGFGRKMA